MNTFIMTWENRHVEKCYQWFRATDFKRDYRNMWMSTCTGQYQCLLTHVQST